ncbi:hypothetical protein V5799_025513 [Amblyomma americanum]|uniref:Uncharacterized protein n=1 Tax=Amblyomma americanum TaxID=6943 RepID=A0AAQ4E909_AMBAM
MATTLMRRAARFAGKRRCVRWANNDSGHAPPSGQRQRTFKKVESNSFLTNLFMGEANVTQIFPYPDVLTADQTETLRLLVGPLDKFLTGPGQRRHTTLAPASCRRHLRPDPTGRNRR